MLRIIVYWVYFGSRISGTPLVEQMQRSTSSRGPSSCARAGPSRAARAYGACIVAKGSRGNLKVLDVKSPHPVGNGATCGLDHGSCGLQQTANRFSSFQVDTTSPMVCQGLKSTCCTQPSSLEESYKVTSCSQNRLQNPVLS